MGLWESLKNKTGKTLMVWFIILIILQFLEGFAFVAYIAYDISQSGYAFSIIDSLKEIKAELAFLGFFKIVFFVSIFFAIFLPRSRIKKSFTISTFVFTVTSLFIPGLIHSVIIGSIFESIGLKSLVESGGFFPVITFFGAIAISLVYLIITFIVGYFSYKEY